MTNLRHSFVSAKSDSPDSSLVRPTNWNAKLQYTSTDGSPSGTDASIREHLTADRAYYVNAASGSDNNTGLSTGAAWATMQYAMDFIADELDFAGYGVTVNVASGTYEGVGIWKRCVGQPSPYYFSFIGDNTTPANVIINPSVNTACFSLIGAGVAGQISGFTMASTVGTGRGVEVTQGGVAILGNNAYSTCVGSHIFVYGSGANVNFSGATNTIVAGITALDHLSVANEAFLFGYSATIAMSTPSFTNFAVCSQGRLETILSFSGSTTATGTRYYVDLNGVINTFGAGANAYPGNVAGASATGGIYV